MYPANKFLSLSENLLLFFKKKIIISKKNKLEMEKVQKGFERELTKHTQVHKSRGVEASCCH